MSDWETAGDGWETAESGWETASPTKGKAVIPGTPPQPQRPSTDAEKDKAYAKNILGVPVGIGEQALNLMGGIGGLFTAPIGATLNKLNALGTGKSTDWLKDYESILQASGQTGTNLMPDAEVLDSGSRDAISKQVGNVVNNVLGPLAGGPFPHSPPFLRNTYKEPKPKVDVEGIIAKSKEPVGPADATEHPAPIPNEAQTELPDGAMIQAPQYGVMKGMSRIDENGIPIKADLSMEVQNMENPLQRNLWGDELPRKSEQEAPRGITTAMDQMQPGMRSGAIFREGLQEPLEAPKDLSKAVEDATLPYQSKEGPFSLPDTAMGKLVPNEINGGMGSGQAGKINLRDIQETFARFKTGVADAHEYLKAWTGAFNPVEWKNKLEDLRDPKARSTIVFMSPGVFHDLADQRKKGYLSGPLPEIKRESIREGLQSNEGLSDIPTLFTKTDPKTGETQVWGHEGRHRMDVFKENGIEAVPVHIRDQTIRWGEVEKLPHTIVGETGNSFNFPHILTDRQWAKGQTERLPVGEARDLGPMHRDLQILNDLPNSEQRARDAIAEQLNHGIGGTQRGALLVPGKRKPRPDTVAEPTSPENIALKAERAAKAKALGLEGTPYENVTTLEDVLSDPGKDISKNPARDYASSGVNGMVYRNTDNRVLKYVRHIFTESRQMAEAFSTKHVTGKEGVNNVYRKLDKGEWPLVAEALQEGSRQKIKLTEEAMTAMGMSDNQKAMVNRVYTALDAMYKIGNDALENAGFKPLDYHPGYVPSMFSGAFTSLVGEYKVNKDGSKTFHTKTVVQADTLWGHNKGLEHPSLKGLDVIPLGRKGLNTKTGYSRVYDGFNDIISEIAKHDPEFADLKAEVDHHIAESTKKLYQFDVHEKRKTGVVGAMGNKPWLDQQTNAKQFLEGMINYLEEGSRYYSYQDALNKAGEVTAHPDLQNMPNTLAYVDRYAKHVAGKNLSVFGAAGNALIDFATTANLVGPHVAKDVSSAMRTVSGVHMMGLYNPAFLLTQLSQFWTGGMPEGTAIRNATGLSHVDMTAGFAKAIFQNSAVFMEKVLGKELSYTEPYMRDAYNWAQEQGMMHFSEAELARDVLQSNTSRVAKRVATAPMWLGENMTRPPIYMWYVEMFHRAGLEGNELYTTAKRASDYAMVDYHPDERPMIYSALGQGGQFIGGLTTYKHNLMDQWTTRLSEPIKNPEALAAMFAGAYMFYGISGLPGYQEADLLVQELTSIGKGNNGKTIRQLATGSMEKSKLWDGVLSATTGIDFQSRMSMANLIPDGPVASVVGPHIMNLANILAKGITYARNPNEAALKDFAYTATPVGMKGLAEDALYTDKENYVLNNKGQRKYESPRGTNDAGLDERNTRKYLGIRPIRERLYDENLYARDKAYKNMTDGQRQAMNRLTASINMKDEKGTEKAISDYQAEGGDPKNLNNAYFKQLLEDAGMSGLQRRIIAPKNNIGSMNKYREYQE
jgi:hypothetical protein